MKERKKRKEIPRGLLSKMREIRKQEVKSSGYLATRYDNGPLKLNFVCMVLNLIANKERLILNNR